MLALTQTLRSMKLAPLLRWKRPGEDCAETSTKWTGQPMISIITGVHNQIGMNRLFCEYLHAHTHHAFQLIVVDNMSSDGSGEFFRQQGADVIRNEENYSYSVIQNQGGGPRQARHARLPE